MHPLEDRLRVVEVVPQEFNGDAQVAEAFFRDLIPADRVDRVFLQELERRPSCSADTFTVFATSDMREKYPTLTPALAAWMPSSAAALPTPDTASNTARAASLAASTTASSGSTMKSCHDRREEAGHGLRLEHPLAELADVQPQLAGDRSRVERHLNHLGRMNSEFRIQNSEFRFRFPRRPPRTTAGRPSCLISVRTTPPGNRYVRPPAPARDARRATPRVRLTRRA